MNTSADILQTLNRIMPDGPPAITPQEQHRSALSDQLAGVQQQLDELASAIRACDADIQSPHAITAEVAALEQKRSEALAAGYLRRKSADVRKLDADITGLKASLEPARTKSEGAAAARAVLVSEQSQLQAVIDGLHRDLALAGAFGTDAYARASESVRQEQRRAAATRQEQTAQSEQDMARQRAEEERQRRQRMGQCGPIGSNVPPWLQNMPG